MPWNYERAFSDAFDADAVYLLADALLAAHVGKGLALNPDRLAAVATIVRAAQDRLIALERPQYAAHP